ncbi:hypothetical protein EST38_g6058 [Candolleomyces aberdarensis]|uniref:Uncharacterized protein n=1 Tax=Candolleomyces aberdarensis TaxID=2316362 RepID=A0A4Q2DIJ3_9AGAR|nr:hypothetical protein EST38_g6058 [Candolleomyces aberdarensis]
MNQQHGKRPRRSGGSATGELSPTAAWRESKRPRILSKVHTTLQGVRDPTAKSACRNKLSREEKAVLEELATALSPRGSRYPDIGKGMPSQPFEPQALHFERIPTVSHMIEALNKEFMMPDTDDEDDIQDEVPCLASTSNTSDIIEARIREIMVPDTDDEDDIQDEVPSPPSTFDTGDGQPSYESDNEDEDDSDCRTNDDTSGTGSSDLYSVVTESLGYITSEDGSLLGDVVSDAILEASLEDLKITDYNDLLSMDRTMKRNLLQNIDLAILRRLQLKKLIDEIDIGTVLLDRLDQDLRRLTLNATSVLRMMELTDTVISGSFIHPVIGRGTLVPNDLDLFTTLKTFGMVLSYLGKKGYGSCKEVYPQGSRRPAYMSNLEDISFIFELRNKKAYKINVIVSKGRPLLPILQFHSTPVMNYIAYHGLVCLYDITIYQLGINNYVNPPARVQQCIVKYERRGFEIWDRFEEEHTCKIDGCCPQTIRSLFDRDVVHFRFPDSAEVPHGELRKSEAEVAVWRLATGAMCKATTNDDAGFVICDSEYTVLRR